jgi:hypothetical protein
MFQIYVINQKVQGMEVALHYYFFFKMKLLGRLKIENILDIIEIKKKLDLNKCTH